MKKLILGIVDALCILLLLSSVMVLLTVIFTESGKAPKIMGFSLLRVISESMEPEIGKNDILLVKEVAPAQLTEGDVISFYSSDPSLDGSINTHRIVGIQSRSDMPEFITKGDANPAVDRYTVSSDSILGVVIWHSHAIGKIVHLLSNPLIFVGGLIVPLAVILILSLIRSFRYAKQIACEEEEKEKQEILEILKEKQRQIKSNEQTNEAVLQEEQEKRPISNEELRKKALELEESIRELKNSRW